MAYQSIFPNGQVPTVNGKSNPYAGDFHPGEFAKVNADIAAKQAQQAAAPPQGPSGFWGRIQHVGVSAVNALEAPGKALAGKIYAPLATQQNRASDEENARINQVSDLQQSGKAKFGVLSRGNYGQEAPSEAAQNTRVVGSSTSLGGKAKAVGSSLVSAENDVYQRGKTQVQQFTNPGKGPGVDNIMKAQAAAQAAVKSGKVNPSVVKTVGQIQSPEDKIFAYRTLADPNLSDKQRNDKLVPIIQKQSDTVKKALGDALQISALVVGGGSTAKLLTSKEALATGLAVNAAAGTAGSVGNTLSENPRATGKELIKSGAGGAVFGAGTALLGAVGGKVAKDVQTILGKNKDVTSVLANNAANALIKKGQDLNKSVKVGVKDVSTEAEKVGVKTPTRPGIKEVSETNKINVRTPDQMSDNDYVKQLTKISKSYDKQSAALKDLTPAEQKAQQTAIDARHQKMVEDLNDQYNKPSLTPQKAPQKIAGATTPAGKTTGGLGKSNSESTPKKVEVSEKPVPKSSVTTKTETLPSTKISGSALKTEQKAVEAKLTTDLGEKTSYNTHPYGSNAEKAVKLVHDDPEKALQIATGKVSGDNVVHEVAVRRALEAQAIKDKDVDTLMQIASSPQHGATSEAAQRLGAEGYNATKDSAVDHIRAVSEARVAAAEKKSGSITKAVSDTSKEIKSSIKAPSKSEWSMFVESLKC